MNKKLLTGVVISMLGSGAFAQAPSGSVTLYGVVDAALTAYKGVERDDGTKHSVFGVDSGLENGSRFGLKGAEDLGGGTSVIFQLEAGFNVDDGKSGQGGVLFGRQAYVGITDHALGVVKLGRQYSYLDDIVGNGDALGNSFTGGSGNLVFYQDRIDNSISYTTSTYAGLSAGIMYGFGEQAGARDKASYSGAMLAYTNDDFYAQLGYGKGNLETNEALDVKDLSQYALGLSYDFKVVKLFGLVSVAKFSPKASISSNPSGSSVIIDNRYDNKVKVALIGASVPFGANTVMFSVGVAKIDDKNPSAVPDSSTAKQVAFAYTYSVSKRTDLYASYAYIKNDKYENFSTISGNQGLAVGIRHNF